MQTDLAHDVCLLLRLIVALHILAALTEINTAAQIRLFFDQCAANGAGLSHGVFAKNGLVPAGAAE